MFYIINRTTQTDEKSSVMEWGSESWPSVESLGAFAKPNDTVELVEVKTENLHYHGISYVRQKIFTFGMERVNKEGTAYLTAQEKANDWLENMLRPKESILPHPRCGKCYRKAEENAELQSLADTGLCWGCRTPRQNVLVTKN